MKGVDVMKRTFWEKHKGTIIFAGVVFITAFVGAKSGVKSELNKTRIKVDLWLSNSEKISLQ